MKKPILLSWSGGKDSALALHALRSSPDFEPAGLLTTINEDYDRISVHGVRRELLERQAAMPIPEVDYFLHLFSFRRDGIIVLALKALPERRRIVD